MQFSRPPCLANDRSMIQPQKGKIKNNGFMKYVSLLGSEWLVIRNGMDLSKIKVRNVSSVFIKLKENFYFGGNLRYKIF